ncbi:ScbA/BarX family gamma-butyrolactone biosynthesis protein [Streptomyces sp. NPDC004539]|uniref:ScbA/BarX family gamma-butyrolactone biosynthesis protein n=1 Tax=Streptomyces sp. NPDC004539 TaxID=3154280 RepID=UPI00339F4162
MSSSAHIGSPTADLHQLARKERTDEVFVRQWQKICPHIHTVTLAWPRSHAFYTLGSGVTSPMLLAETVRQALAVLSHEAQGVPLNHRLGWEHAHYTFTEAALRPRSEPMDVRLRVTHERITRRKLGSARLIARIEAACADGPLGTAVIQYITHPPAIYDRLRGTYADARRAFAAAPPPPAPVAPPLVDRTAPEDVVIAPGTAPHRFRLRVDTSHPVLFDHPHDHIPGMVLLEAVVQAARVSVPGDLRPVALDTAFQRYVEFDTPCWIELEPAAPDETGQARYAVTGTQNGRPVFTTTVTLNSLESLAVAGAVTAVR